MAFTVRTSCHLVNPLIHRLTTRYDPGVDGLIWYWLSSDVMTVTVGVRGGYIIETPPIVRRFKGQKITALIGWMRQQKGFVME